MKDRRTVIKGVLADFLSADSEVGVSYEDTFVGLVLDDEEIELLSTAIDEALESNK